MHHNIAYNSGCLFRPCYNQTRGFFQKEFASHSKKDGYLPWMASLSPSPTEFLPNKCKFQGISVFSHLLPLDHDRQTCLSDSSRLRRLNGGVCHTLKFALFISSSKQHSYNRGPLKLGFALYQKSLNL